MSIDLADPATIDQRTRTTRGLLLATAVIGGLELAFAVAIAVYTYVDIAGMTPQERTDSWAELGYVFAVFIGAPPALAAVLGGAGWGLRRHAAGVAFSVVALCLVSLEALVLLHGVMPW